MRKVMIKISQGSVVTQTVFGGLMIHLPVANFLCFISAKNYEIWLRVDKVIAMNTVCSFFWPTLYVRQGLYRNMTGFPDFSRYILLYMDKNIKTCT